MRVERETLRRFPRTNCVLFTIRTYVAPITSVLDDVASAASLATAVDAMPPDIVRYKDLSSLGPAVSDYLWHDGLDAERDELRRVSGGR